MAILVKRRDDDDQLYALLGTGLGAYMAAQPHWLFGDWGRDEDSDVLPAVAVCDRHGRVQWMKSEDIFVVSIDGVRPADVCSP